MKKLLFILSLSFLSFFASCSNDSDSNNDYVSFAPVDELEFDYMSSCDTLTISSSGIWECQSLPEWIVAEPMSGYNGDKLVISVKENTSLDNRSAVLVVSSGEATSSLTVTQYGRLQTDYIDLQFDKSGVSYVYDATNGDLSVTYSNGVVPHVEPGKAIVLPAEKHYDIRVIDNVSTEGNTINMQTSQGNMSNLFRNINFTLSTSPNTTRSAGGRVYTPVSCGYIDDAGNYHETHKMQTRSQYTHNEELWSFEQDFSGEHIANGVAGELLWDKCTFNAGLNGEFTFDFGSKSIDEVREIGDLKKFSYTLTGDLNIDMLARYRYTKSYNESGDEIIKDNIIKTGVFKFQVGAVPVVILVYTHLGKCHSTTIDGEIEATCGLQMNNEITARLEWTADGGVSPSHTVTPSFTPYPLTVEARASLEAKVSYYPQIEFGIYKFIGPWVEPRPYLKETLGAGAYASTDGRDEIGWQAKGYTGMDIRMGLNMDFGFWDKEIWTSEIYNPVKDQLLFEAPSRISKQTPENGTEVKKGETIEAEYLVESYCPVNNKYYPCPLALVNFEAERGKLNTQFGITDINGRVSVKYTPQPTENNVRATRAGQLTDCELKANIINSKGEIIDADTLILKIEGGDSCNDANHVHAVDLGLSVKWACCNVGASSPEEYGDYFAWGETSPKSSYTWENSTTYDLSNSELKSKGIIDSDGNLTAAYDAARANWGGNWRMPTYEEIRELIDECQWTWTTQNGVKGYKVTGPNGNSIFLPAAGYRGNTSLLGAGSIGYYWSATPDSGSYNAYDLYFYSGRYGWYGSHRSYGHSVRPVSE